MIPTKTEYEIGSTIHGQPLRLVHSKIHGRAEWILYRDEANQQDDRVFIAGLTRENILKMAEAVQSQPCI